MSADFLTILTGTQLRQVNEVMHRVDWNSLIDEIDWNNLMEHLDVDAIMQRLDVNAVVERIDVSESQAFKGLHATKFLLALADLASTAQVNAVIERSNLKSIIARSSKLPSLIRLILVAPYESVMLTPFIFLGVLLAL